MNRLIEYLAVVAGRLLVVVLCCAASSSLAGQGERIAGFARSPYFAEQVRITESEDGVRVLVNASDDFRSSRPTRILVYATPNGSTIEESLGCRAAPGLTFRFGIQHVAAQLRCLRSLVDEANLVLVCVQAKTLSWPAWRAGQERANAKIRSKVMALLSTIPGVSKTVTLAGHSGGGSFLWGFIEGGDHIPDVVERILFLDANYSYDDDRGHGDQFLAWLRATPHASLCVIAYDDRDITLNGKRVVGSKGGTYRATDRMLARMGRDLSVETSRQGPLETKRALDGRLTIVRHLNPENKILHSALVGEMNGLLYGLTFGSRIERTWGAFGDPPVYTQWIQPLPGSGVAAPIPRPTPLPSRREDAPAGRVVMASVAPLSLRERERRIVAEIAGGNVPSWMRETCPVTVSARCRDGKKHTVTYRVLADYLAVGGDDDFVRVPLTPVAAQRLADQFGFRLPTRRMVAQIHDAAGLKIAPKPMTEKRESVATFVSHHEIIETQRGGAAPGVLLSGIKKDVVVTRRLTEQPGRVAIFGWCYPSGKPIQPLYIGHSATYVDYSHGVRWVAAKVLLDGKATDLATVLKDPVLHELLSDEGVLSDEHLRYHYESALED